MKKQQKWVKKRFFEKIFSAEGDDGRSNKLAEWILSVRKMMGKAIVKMHKEICDKGVKNIFRYVGKTC